MAELNKGPPTFTEVLRNKHFVRLLAGQFFSNIGDAVLRVALLLYVYSFTGSLSTTTLILSVQIIPWIIIGPIAGVFADRISRKGIMVSADITRAIAIVFIPMTQDILTIVGLSFVIGIASASFTAPRSAAIPEITGMRLFVKGISISQLIFQSISLIGPLVGAFVFAEFGAVTFLISSAGFALSAIIISLTKIPNATRLDTELSISIVISDLKEGFSFLAENEVTRNVLLLFSFVILASAYASPLIYPYIYDILHNSNQSMEGLAQREYGIIGSITAGGSIVGNLIFGKFEKKIGRKQAIFIGTIAMGIFFVLFAGYPSLQLLGILSFIFGFFNGMSSLAVNAIFAEAVPNKIRGRAYSATNAFLQTFTALFTALSGVTADLLGIVQTMTVAGVILIVFTLIYSKKTKFKFLEIEPLDIMNSV